MADTINAVNQRIGMTEYFWEHRSFKEQRQKYSAIVSKISNMKEQISYLESLLNAYMEYEPFISSIIRSNG